MYQPHVDEGITAMKRDMKRRRNSSLGWRTLLGGCPLLSYKRIPSPPSYHTLDPFLLHIVAAPPSTLLRSSAKILVCNSYT
jgi:hypothetical protein